MTMTQIGIQLRYRLPGAQADIDQLFVGTAELAEQARALLAGEIDLSSPEKPEVPALAGDFAALVAQIGKQVDEDKVRMADGKIDNPIAGTNIQPSCTIGTLRQFASSPKQVAMLLGCHSGYFNDGQPNPQIYFSRLRFQPAPGFFDLAIDGESV